ncbi:Hsp20/alpha crystallin family protein [Halorubrum cibi]|uniref:Molecular chaperone IbpA, HSP20 family n=1 Tax=Halorubrum cibi TaxID=413815 RepID=A0A521CF53_9EURY|nr:Hsp20/alpha crystallin family protein [Halorubrum cibi]SMO58064.1 Molecular chaperone IbpA, HSP20 family [Halorubrum cibi]
MSALRDALRDLPDAVFADLLESDDGYVLLVDLPGATAGTTEVLFEDGRIVIEARREKSTPEGFRYVREDRPLFLDAELPLPPDADGDDADAEMDRGVLEVTLPKRADADSHRIPVEGSDDGGSAEETGGDHDEAGDGDEAGA